MKKNLILLLLTGAMILGMTGCGKAATASDSASESMEIANPFVSYDTLEEAEAAAGFDITVPETADGESITDYEVMTSEDASEIFLQVIYGDAEEEDDICVRKAVNVDSADLSGYYFSNPETNTVDINGNSVLLTAEDGSFYTATWDAGDYAYAVVASSGTEMEPLQEIAAAVE